MLCTSLATVALPIGPISAALSPIASLHLLLQGLLESVMIFGCIAGLSLSSRAKRACERNWAASAVLVIAPSPLAGEGNSLLPSDEWVRVFAQTPHPFEIVGTSLRPLPQGERAREATPPPRHDFFTGSKADDPVTATLS